jgi:hypothetical protein
MNIVHNFHPLPIVTLQAMYNNIEENANNGGHVAVSAAS